MSHAVDLDLDLDSPDRRDRDVATAIHVGTLAAQVLTAGLLHVLVPSVALALTTGGSAWLRGHVREQLNFQITYVAVALVAAVVIKLTFGVGAIIALPALFFFFVVDIVASIKAARAASRGDAYRFPYCLRIF